MIAAAVKRIFSFPVVFGFYEPGQNRFVRIGMFYQGAAGVVAPAWTP